MDFSSGFGNRRHCAGGLYRWPGLIRLDILNLKYFAIVCFMFYIVNVTDITNSNRGVLA